MKIVLPILASLVLAGLGCIQQSPDDGRDMLQGQVRADGLVLTLDVPDRFYNPGDTMNVNVSVHNTTGAPVEITSRTSAKIILEVRRYDEGDWVAVKRYPEISLQVLTPWSLAAGETRTFDRQLPIERDWPVAETLRLVARVNGRDELRAFVTFRIAQAQSR